MYSQVTDFVHQLFGTEETVPLHAPLFIGNEKKYLNECIDTTFVSSVGKFVDRFEEEIAAYTGAQKAVVCVSGTNALHMATSPHFYCNMQCHQLYRCSSRFH